MLSSTKLAWYRKITMSCEWKNVFMLLFFLYNFIFTLRNLCVCVEIRIKTSELMLCCPSCQ